MLHVFFHTLLETAKTIPFLFLVYIIIEVLQAKMAKHSMAMAGMRRFGPILGAAVGCVPQCGFSASFAALYNGGVVGGATLVAVFLSTSDEAIPVMLSQPDQWLNIVYLIISKLVIAIAAGYILQYTLFRKEKRGAPAVVDVEFTSCERQEHHHHSPRVTRILLHALYHTGKVILFLFVTLLLISLLILWIGEERLQSVLLTGSVFQPILAGLIGLIPGCAASVTLTQLLLSGSISFGSAIAGLSAGAGFGYIVLLRGCKSKKESVKIIAVTYFCAAASGMIIDGAARFIG